MEIKPDIETSAAIKVVGVGGGGGASINRMIKAQIKGVHFLAVDDDIQALSHSQAPQKIHIGKNITRGLGAGMDPEIGMKAAQESETEIRDALKGSDMVFITCGLGGGTGSGASPVVAEIAKDCGALTVAVVTKPFKFEGNQRTRIADEAFDTLKEKVDTIIVIPNDRVLETIDQKTTLIEAFDRVDDVLQQGVQGISDLITVPGSLINVDFADVRSIMKGQGNSLMGIGKGTGDNRALDAAKNAISSPLLDLSIQGAQGVLFTITGDAGLTMHEVNEAAHTITEMADPDAKIIFGANIREDLQDEVRVTVVATGFDTPQKEDVMHEQPVAEPYRPTSYVMSQQQNYREQNQEFVRKDVAQEQRDPFNRPIQTQSKPIEDPYEHVEPVKPEPVETQTIEKEAEVNRMHDRVKEYMRMHTEKQERREASEKEKPVIPSASNQEDLDIPAFIRKKMM